MVTALVFSAILIYYLRRFLKKEDVLQDWIKNATWSIWIFIAMAFIVGSGILPVFLTYPVTILLVGGLVYLMFKEKVLNDIKPLLLAVLPLIIITVLEDLLEWIYPSFYDKWSFIFSTGSFFAFIYAIVMYVQYRKQQKTRELEKLIAEQRERELKASQERKAELEIQVAQRTADLTKQKEALQKTVEELKATQSQLVHAEKMASLGELTAGIAHEIQNPLNFVNNFSEVSEELLDEMIEEIRKGDIEEVKAIAEDIKQNLSKIKLHGKRADSIVKGMLMHSRTSNNQKEPTDINALADEYLRLAYHGLRAKDKSFNADFKSDFDQTIPSISIIPQDIGRVILNLINNAFYACNDKLKQQTEQNNTEKYVPLVHVATRKLGNKVEITISDNGPGIPDKIKNKIFQPFFTTKPSGQGTGLGLSLSYDLVKAHGGDLKLTSEIGKGTVFTIQLPLDRK